MPCHHRQGAQNKNTMTLNEYQQQAMKTCMSSSNNFSYMMLNLVGEVGEFASKVAKMIRKKTAFIGAGKSCNHIGYLTSDYAEQLPELQKEAGDILWQLAGLCSVMGWSLDDIAQQNLDKLASRQERGKIDGDGDNR